MTAQHLAGVEKLRRAAILVAQVADLHARLADATLAMFVKYSRSRDQPSSRRAALTWTGVGWRGGPLAGSDGMG